MCDLLPEVKKADDEVNNDLFESYRGEKTGWLYVGENNYFLPSKYADDLENFHNFEIRTDDVWIVTFPRSGTTLSQDLVWLLLNNFDYETASELNLWARTPFFEFHLLLHDEVKKGIMEENEGNPEGQMFIENFTRPAYEVLKDMKSPRLIKTHLPVTLLPKGVEGSNKIIYVARNPKDVIPSFYFLLRLWKTSDYSAGFRNFWRQFKEGHVLWTPFWSHISEGWERRHNENFLFLFYEDIVQDLPEAIKKIADFLEVEATEEQVQGLAEHMSISNFSKNKSVNMEGLKEYGMLNENEPSFIRKGHKRERPPEFEEVEEEIEQWIQENYELTDLRFP